jgi:hypothetical protein
MERTRLLAEYIANAPVEVREAYEEEKREAQRMQQEAQRMQQEAQRMREESQDVLRTAEAAVLAACELLKASGRYAEARSLQPWLDKLDVLSMQMQVGAASCNNKQGHADEGDGLSKDAECFSGGDSSIQDHSSLAWIRAAAHAGHCGAQRLDLKSYRHQLMRLWLNIALQSL